MEKTLLAGPSKFKSQSQIRITGTKKDIEKAEELLKAIPDIEHLAESDARLKIQAVIVKHNLKASILFEGNSMWNGKPIIRNLRRIIEQGTLYDGKKPAYVAVGSMLRFPVVEKCILSDYFYKFLTLCCGSIAHYNKQGWVTEYPTLEDLKAFFKKNEYGHRVLDHIPAWQTDARSIVEQIEMHLFPLQSRSSSQS